MSLRPSRRTPARRSNAKPTEVRRCLLQDIVLGSPGMSHASAVRRLDKLFRAVVDASPEHWAYEDVLNCAAADGFEGIQAAEWWEHQFDLILD